MYDLGRYLSDVAKMWSYKMAEIEKEEVEFPVCYQQGESNKRQQQVIHILDRYIHFPVV